jgi:hypothetical protein
MSKLLIFKKLLLNLLFSGEAHERIERIRMFHAHPFDSFSCISFKESPLGAEHAFLIQRASFFNKIESYKNAFEEVFDLWPTNLS